MRNTRFVMASGAAVLLLAACSGGGSSASNPIASRPQAMEVRAASKPRFAGWLSEEAKGSEEKLYVSDYYADAVYIYNAANLAKIIGTITSGLDAPLGNFIDAQGTLYVANGGENTGVSSVAVYPKGQLTPSKIYTNGLSGATNVVVGSDGTIYVPNFRYDSVVVYGPGKTSPTETLSVNAPVGVTLDSKNNLYVSYQSETTGEGAIEEFGPKKKTGKDLGITVTSAGDLKIMKSGDIVLEDQENQLVDFYKPGATSPYGSISAGVDTNKLALNSAETLLYISDFSTTVPVYVAKPSGRPMGMVSGLQSSGGVSLSPAPPL